MLTSRAVCGILIERLRNAAEKQQKLTAALVASLRCKHTRM